MRMLFKRGSSATVAGNDNGKVKQMLVMSRLSTTLHKYKTKQNKLGNQDSVEVQGSLRFEQLYLEKWESSPRQTEYVYAPDTYSYSNPSMTEAITPHDVYGSRKTIRNKPFLAIFLGICCRVDTISNAGSASE